MLEQINKDLVTSMKEKNKISLNVLRMLKSALQLESINKKDELTDNDIIVVIKRQIKMRTDAIEEFKKFNKTEEITNLENEISILKKYLPEELSEDEIEKRINDAFLVVKPTSMKDMGLIMKELQSIAPFCDMSLVSKKVKDKLLNL